MGMKVVKYNTYGNIKMRGRKNCVLSCRCCDIVNFSDKIIVKQAEQEIKTYNTKESE